MTYEQAIKVAEQEAELHPNASVQVWEYPQTHTYYVRVQENGVIQRTYELAG